MYDKDLLSHRTKSMVKRNKNTERASTSLCHKTSKCSIFYSHTGWIVFAQSKNMSNWVWKATENKTSM